MPNSLTTYVHHHSKRVAGTLREGRTLKSLDGS